MTVVLLTVVVALAATVAALGVVMVRRQRLDIEWPEGLNSDVLERLEALRDQYVKDIGTE